MHMSWYEADVAIDPLGSENIAPDLLENIERTLQRYREGGLTVGAGVITQILK